MGRAARRAPGEVLGQAPLHVSALCQAHEPRESHRHTTAHAAALSHCSGGRGPHPAPVTDAGTRAQPHLLAACGVDRVVHLVHDPGPVPVLRRAVASELASGGGRVALHLHWLRGDRIRALVLDRLPAAVLPDALQPRLVLALYAQHLDHLGTGLQGNLPLQRQFVKLTLVFGFQSTITFVYPAFTYFFKRLSGFPQVAFALLLPFMKLSAKNLMSYLLHEVEDSKPQFIIFNVEIFHALFVVCCLQNTSSFNTTIVLIVMDFVHAVLSLHKVNAAIDEFNTSILERMNEEDVALWRRIDLIKARSHETRLKATRILPSSLTAVRTTVMFPLKNATFKGAGVTTANGITTEKPSSRQSDHHRIQPPPPQTDDKADVLPESKLGHIAIANSLPKSSRIQPSESTAAALHLNGDHHLSAEEQRVVLSLDDESCVRFVQHVLRLLYWIEFLLLVEFTEVFIPLVYSAYLIISFQLPNRVYYAQLRDIDADKLHNNVANVLLYASLEFVSLVAMALLLRYKLRISAVRQLTFVLESQWQQVQSKLVLWVSFVLQAALDHVGVDYGFTFAWLHHHQPN